MAYSRSHSFTDDQASNPNQALPGDQLDSELDAVSAETDALKTQIDDIRRADGALVNGIVTSDSLAEGLEAELVGDIDAQMQPYVDSAEAAQTGAEAARDQAVARAAAALSSQTEAAGSVTLANVARVAAEAARTGAEAAETSALVAETAAANSANAAAGSAAAAELAEETAAQWAEYLAGPVAVNEIPPDGLPPEAVESGYFSARWWANRAEQVVDLTAKWYLGPFDEAPTEAVLGAPLVEGMYYWDTTADTFYVWSGAAWLEWALSAGIATVLVVSDATSDLEADHVAGFNEFANRTSFVRQPGELLFWTWPSSGGSTYLYGGTDDGDPGPWATVAGDWASFSPDTYAPLTHFRDNGADSEILQNGVVAVDVTGTEVAIAGSRRITGLGDPTGAQDAATRGWVEAQDFVTGSGPITALQGDIATLQGEQTVQDGRLDALEAVTADGTSGNAALDGRLDALGIEVAQLDGELGVQQTLVNSLQATVANPTTGVAANAAAISGLDTRVTTAEGTIVAQSSRLDAVEADIADGATGNAALASAISALDARVTTNEGDLTSNAAAITALDSRVTTAEGEITGQATAISTLETTVGGLVSESARIDALEATVNNPTTGVGANATAVDALDTRVTATEGSITAQASDITTLTTTVGDNTTSITAALASINGIEARYSVQIDGGGRVTGIELIGGGGVSEFNVLASAFNVLEPSAGLATPRQMFSVEGGVVRAQNMEISGSLLVDTINASLLNLDGVTLENDGGELRVAGVDWSTHVGGAGKPEDNATANVSVLGYYQAYMAGSDTFPNGAGSASTIDTWTEEYDLGVNAAITGGNVFTFSTAGRYEIHVRLGLTPLTSLNIGVRFELQRNNGSGWVSIARASGGAIFQVNPLTGYIQTVSLNQILDLSAGHQLRIVGWANGTNYVQASGINSMFIAKRLTTT